MNNFYSKRFNDSYSYIRTPYVRCTGLALFWASVFVGYFVFTLVELYIFQRIYTYDVQLYIHSYDKQGIGGFDEIRRMNALCRVCVKLDN